MTALVRSDLNIVIAFDTHSSSLEDKIALNNINGTKKEVASTELIANQLLAIVGHEIESSDDGEYREHLKKVAEKVKIRILNFYSELSALMAVANDENAAVGQFSDAVKSMSQNLKDLGDIVKKYKGHVLQHSAGIYEKTEYIEATEVEKVHEVETEQAAPEPSVMSEQEILGIAVTTEVGGDDAIRALTSAIKDLVVSQEAAPLLLPAEEARQDPIKVLAIFT